MDEVSETAPATTTVSENSATGPSAPELDLMCGHALLEVFEPVQHNLDLGSSSCSRLLREELYKTFEALGLAVA